MKRQKELWEDIKRVLDSFWRKVDDMLGMRWTSVERVADVLMGDLMKEERMVSALTTRRTERRERRTMWKKSR